VHQDGTCNGLQHYAALGGDVIGAKQVNLDVSDKPSDVYTYVAEMVKAQIDKDAAEGHELARMLRGKISRKVVKQTVSLFFGGRCINSDVFQLLGHDYSVRSDVHWCTRANP
jgi:DNA-directed RNA polymerase